MSEKTTNYNLEKPLQNEFYDVIVQNRNMDKIDEELKKAAGHIKQEAKHITEAERLSWNNKANTTVATPATNGLMSAADKGKLNGIAVGANNYVHPNDTNSRHVTDAEKTSWNSKANTAVATAAANGLMSAADKGKLDGVATGANKTVIANNLTTSVVGSALDAIQGRILDGKVTEVNDRLSGENLGINGNFDIWQRGTSFSNPANNTYVADMWQLYNIPTTVEQSRDIPNVMSKYSMKIISSDIGNTQLRWKSEEKYVGEVVNISFYAKGDGGYIKVNNGDSGGTALQINTTSTWTKYSTSFVQWNCSLNVPVMFAIESGGHTVNIAQIKLELGDRSTKFVPPNYSTELTKCQRYFHRIKTDYSSPIAAAIGHATGSKHLRFDIKSPIRLTCPTINFNKIGYYPASSTIASYTEFNNVVWVGGCLENSIMLQGTIQGTTTLNSVYTIAFEGSDSYIDLSAEL